MEIVLALISALLFALGTVLQQRAGTESPHEGGGSGVLLGLVRNPVWLAGIAADGLGFVAQAAALGIGRLAVVQPLLVASVVFALPLGARLSHQPIRRADVLAAGLVVVALAGFLIIANPVRRPPRGAAARLDHRRGRLRRGLPARAAARAATGRRRAGPRCSAPAPGSCSRCRPRSPRPSSMNCTPASCTSSSSWELYALAGVGYASMTLNQLALNTGALAATIATSTAFDPITSVVLGLALFHESLHATGARIAGILIALGLAPRSGCCSWRAPKRTPDLAS